MRLSSVSAILGAVACLAYAAFTAPMLKRAFAEYQLSPSTLQALVLSGWLTMGGAAISMAVLILAVRRRSRRLALVAEAAAWLVLAVCVASPYAGLSHLAGAGG